MKAIVILSGGMDSTVTLYRALQTNDEVLAVSFDYGQKHKKELLTATLTCEKLNVPHKIINLDFMLDVASNSALTSDMAVPEGHYESENMKLTVVPNRNAIMFNITLGYALNIKANNIYLGIHSGDHAIYPDCREYFLAIMQEWAHNCDDDFKIDVYAPFLNKSKNDVAIEGVSLGVDFGLTWTCYKGQEEPCGKCGACQERAEAFAAAGVPDPLLQEYIGE